MQLIVASHPSGLEHDTSRNHPERPERATSVEKGLSDSSLDLVRLVSPQVRRSELELVHDSQYIDMIEAFCSMGGGALDMDTIVSAASWEAALTASGGLLATIEELGGRTNATGFVVARPPGHHALRDRAMGFCVFNNVAVAAAWLRQRGQRVAILDWDVHHGNGTEALVRDDSGILYVSLHQSPFYPFEGEIAGLERGSAPGTVLDIPLVAGTGGDVYREAWQTVVLPVVSQFEPDWVLVSAGYDAHHLDQLAGLRLVSDDYGFMTQELSLIHPPERTVFSLEGGYDLDALRESARTTVEGLAGGFDAIDPLASQPEARAAVEVVRQAASKFFNL